MKNQKDNIIKRWYKLCEPNKKLWFGQIFTYTIYTVMLFLITIFAAKTINCMYNQEWIKALIYLGLELSTIILRNLAMHFEYILYGKQHIAIRGVIAKKIYNKILSVDDKKAKEFSKERVLNITLNNMVNAAEFPDAVAVFFASIIQVAITLITVYFSNWLAGIVITILGIINFVVYYKVNKKLGRIMLNRHEKKDEVYKTYNKIMEGKLVINEYQGSQQYETKILQDVNTFSNEYAKYYNVYSYKNHIYNILWRVVVYAVTALMLFFVSKGTLDISIYLIIVPYLTSCTEKLTTLFDRTSALENMRVDVDRVNLILNLDEKQLIKYGQFNKESQGYNLGLIDVSCKGTGDSGNIKNADISFKMGCINVIKGERGSGKRVVFNLLRRNMKPEKGKILLDNLDLYDYNKKTFKNHIDYCASHPVFIRGSIKENLLIAKNNFNDVKNVCEKFGLNKIIEKYAKGYDTNIEEIKSSGILFLIGLVRALLSNCKILMIYELPLDTPASFRKKVLKYLQNNKINKTVIIFTHSDDFDNMADMLYTVSKGKVQVNKIKK